MLDNLDLDINNYELSDLYNLFNIQDKCLDRESMKNAKQIVLKMHPDKSKLDSKYFLFFSNAYKKLYAVYEFQNKSTNKQIDANTYYKEENVEILNNLLEKNKKLKNPKDFNKWFNEQFEKHKIQTDEEDGYGNWLKTDEGLYSTQSVTQATMHEEFEKQKKKIQALTTYNGISDPFASTLGGSLLGKNDDYSSGLFNNGLTYQDLKQAHLETVIPITQEDYQNTPKFRSEQEYKAYRDRQDVKPLDEKEALYKLRNNNKLMEEESANLAFYYAKQNEQALKQNNHFWASLKHISNG
jgi:hypothetical protein